MPIISVLKKLYGLITGSSFFWKVLKNYSVLSNAFKTIEEIIAAMSKDARALPTQDESLILVKAISNILKTGVIDIPGVDEYQLSINLDMVSSQISIGIEDSKTGKYHELSVPKK